jgi:hypothetical protein
LERAVEELSKHTTSPQPEPEAAAVPEVEVSMEEHMQRSAVVRKTTIELAKRRMAQEPRDPAWAPQYEAAILEGTKTAFPNLRIEAAGCRSTICDVKVSSKTQLGIDEFLRDFMQTYPDFGRAHYELQEAADGSYGVEMHMIRREAASLFVQEVESGTDRALQEAG